MSRMTAGSAAGPDPVPAAGAVGVEVEVEVSVVMPCLNEARTVGLCVGKAVAALARMGVSGEVIVADNGSTDGSPEVAAAGGARVVRVEDRGYGAALRAGIAAARGRYVVIGDADDSYDFGAMGPFVESLRGGSEMVVGNRFRGGIRPGAMPWHHRYIGNPALTGLLNLFFHTPVGDAHCGLRAFRKDAYQRLRLTSPGMEFASEMIIQANLNRLRVTEVPTVLYPDGRDRPPHLRSFRDGWRHLRLLLLLCPTWLYLIPAGLMISLGLGLMAALTPGPLRLRVVVLDVHTMLLGALFVLLGYQTLGLWASARAYGRASGLLPSGSAADKVLGRYHLERGLLAGAALLAVGLAVNLSLVVGWARHGFGAMEVGATMRRALWGVTLMVLGVQTVYTSFFLGLLAMDPRSRPDP